MLAEVQRTGDKERFISALTYYSKNEFAGELVVGMQRQIFTGYFHEMLSDTLLLLNSFYTNNYRGAMIAVRCMLEDLYRHLFYKDHPQEFLAQVHGAQTERDLGISPGRLRQYLPRTRYLSVFNELDDQFSRKPNPTSSDLFSLNEDLYAECSSFVHASEYASMNSFQTNADLLYCADKVDLITRVVARFVKMAVAFLTAAHLDHVLAFNEYERSMVLNAFSAGERAGFRRALNL